MNSVQKAVAALLSHPFQTDGLEEELKTVRANKEEAAPYIYEVLDQEMPSMIPTYDPYFGLVYPAFQGYDYFSKAAGLSLLADLEDPQALEKIIATYQAAGDLSENEVLQEFGFNLLPWLMQKTGIDKPELLARIMLDQKVDDVFREAAMNAFAHNFRVEKRVPVELAEKSLLELIEKELPNRNADGEEFCNCLVNGMRAGAFTQIPAVVELVKSEWAPDEEQGLESLEEVLNAPALLMKLDEPMTYEWYQKEDFASRFMPGILKATEIDEEEPIMDPVTDPNTEVDTELDEEALQMEAILNELENMSQPELQAFAQQNPALIQKLMKYVRANTPQQNFLENKKKSAPTASLADFKSKKKKKGGKKAAKSKKKK